MPISQCSVRIQHQPPTPQRTCIALRTPSPRTTTDTKESRQFLHCTKCQESIRTSRNACLPLLLSCSNLSRQNSRETQRLNPAGTEQTNTYVGSTATAPMYINPPATNGMTCIDPDQRRRTTGQVVHARSHRRSKRYRAIGN